jgi:HSP20 family molecular chaperone IbpA
VGSSNSKIDASRDNDGPLTALTLAVARRGQHVGDGALKWSERWHLSLVRSFQLHVTAQLSKITVKIDNGVLQVLVPTHKPP